VSARTTFALTLAVLCTVLVPALPAAGDATRGSVEPCSPRVRYGVLPVWMRGGFGPSPRTTYALGRRGAIGAVLWGARTFDSPPARHRSNKILWVPRHLSKTVAPLWIKLQMMEGTHAVGAPVRRVIPTGPGPSLVDAPSPGCWRLTLTWSGRRDTLDLAYVPPSD
jgi:hypothetical protein